MLDRFKNLLRPVSRLLLDYRLRGKTVYVVCGLRRSGNHAFINWLTQCLDGSHTQFVDLQPHVHATHSGSVLFFNEVNFQGYFWLLDALKASQRQLDKASHVIISLEDHIPIRGDKFLPRRSRNIAIKRTVLNTLASRLARAKKQAALGLDRGDMRIDDRTIAFLRWLQASERDGWCIWDFDVWLEHGEYRSKFLEDLRLSRDCQPAISTHGDGSSFSGTLEVPDKESLTHRYEIVEWPNRVIDLLMQESNIRFLTPEELAFCRRQLPTDNNKASAR